MFALGTFLAAVCFVACVYFLACFILANLRVLLGAVVVTLVLLHFSKAKADTLELALVSDGSVPVEMMQDAVDQAQTIYTQLGVKLVVISTEVRNDVPTHTNPDALLHDFRAQVSTGAAVADATVLFTTRALNVGSRAYAGMATTGPACTAWQVAIVSTNQAGGPAGYTLGHELGHSLGLEHDDAPGYVMSPDERGTGTFSPQSIAQFNGQFRECLADTLPATLKSPSPSVVSAGGAPTTKSGGGGAMSFWQIVFLAFLIAVVRGLAWRR